MTHRELWDDIRREPIERVRERFAAATDVIKLDGEPSDMHGPPSGAPSALFILKSDYGGMFALTLLPVEAIDATLEAALQAIDGRTFADAGDLKQSQWDAAVLVMAAFANEHRQIEDYLGWVTESETTVSEETIRSYWGRWTGDRVVDVTAWRQLAGPITAVYSMCRAD